MLPQQQQIFDNLTGRKKLSRKQSEAKQAVAVRVLHE
jgi:hypothetical protein